MVKNDSKRRSKIEWLDVCIWIFGIMVYLFLIVPVIIVIISAFSPTEYPQFPPTNFSLKWFNTILTSPDWMNALKISLLLLIIVTPVTVILGTMASYGISRLEFPGKILIQSFIMSPLMIPQVVLGVSLLYIFSMVGLTGTFVTLVIGHMIVVFPYVVRTVGVSVSNLDPKLELASMNLGASPIRTFINVTLPLIKSGIIAGAIFSAVESFGEIQISLFLSSTSTTTVPVQTFSYIQQTFDPSINAIAVIFIVISVIALIVIERTIGLSKVM